MLEFLKNENRINKVVVYIHLLTFNKVLILSKGLIWTLDNNTLKMYSLSSFVSWK